ncbi:hypothetical protein NX059_007101 [Plenodomus lindquistii]|nr:hypothetical protein NX059_007101 [Plenodomus lindquistii]
MRNKDAKWKIGSIIDSLEEMVQFSFLTRQDARPPRAWRDQAIKGMICSKAVEVQERKAKGIFSPYTPKRRKTLHNSGSGLALSPTKLPKTKIEDAVFVARMVLEDDFEEARVGLRDVVKSNVKLMLTARTLNFEALSIRKLRRAVEDAFDIGGEDTGVALLWKTDDGNKEEILTDDDLKKFVYAQIGLQKGELALLVHIKDQ